MTARTPAGVASTHRGVADHEGVDMSKRTCSEANCDRPATVRGICGAHYQEQRRAAAGPCTIADCEEPQRGAELCAKHYSRLRRHGDTGNRASPAKPCGIEGCESKSRVRGWCNKHYRRWVLHGDPLKDMRAERAEAAKAVTSKTCTRCKRELPIADFAPRSESLDGRKSHCEDCGRWYSRDYSERQQKNNPPAVRAERSPCAIEDCRRLASARGWCKGHYERWRCHGDPEAAVRAMRPRRTEAQLQAEEKPCSKCGRVLPLDLFYNRTEAPDGKSYLCRECTYAPRIRSARITGVAAVRNAKVRRRYAEDRGFRDKRAEYFRKYRQKYREDIQERQRATKLWTNYGLTLDEYEAMYREQGGVCKICGSGPHGGPAWARKQWLSVDHCHDTGRIRGLLCDNCNMGLGKFKDSLALLTAATEYLAHASAATP